MKPIDAKTFSQICKLSLDNLSTRGHWLLIDEGRVVLAKQKAGEPCEAKIEVPKAEFDRMVRWYVTGRPTKRKARRASTRGDLK